MAKPPVIAELVWSDALRFEATSGRIAIVVDGDSAAGPSPVQMLVFGLAGCMAADVVDIVLKGRLRWQASSRALSPSAQEPRRGCCVQLQFPGPRRRAPAAVERAIALSRGRYCSVWHSLRQDIELRVV